MHYICLEIRGYAVMSYDVIRLPRVQNHPNGKHDSGLASHHVLQDFMSGRHHVSRSRVMPHFRTLCIVHDIHDEQS